MLLDKPACREAGVANSEGLGPVKVYARKVLDRGGRKVGL